LGPALRAIAADLQPRNHDMEVAVPLNLAFEAVKQVAFELDDFSAAQARHMNVIALRASLIVVLLALHVHQIKLINQSMPLKQAESAIDGYTIDLGIDLSRMAQNLARVQMLLCSLYHAQNGAALACHAQSARHQFGLQTSRNFGFWKWQGRWLRYLKLSFKTVAMITECENSHQVWFCHLYEKSGWKLLRGHRHIRLPR